MRFVNKIMKAVDVLTEDESVGIGNDFEKYVVIFLIKTIFPLSNGYRHYTKA
jgi:hypothetical protein